LESTFKFPGIAEIISSESLKKRVESGKKLRIKLGCDPSRPDIHLGHAVVLRLLRRFQDLGHQVIFVIGDYTAKIGDPSGKNKTRPILSDEEIKNNAATYAEQVGKILDISKAEIRYNSEWLSGLTFADLLKISSMFTVAGMIERDDFRNRLINKHEIGLHEFLYPLMQAYDSVSLQADIELGGTDQKFNFLAGRELQKKMGAEPQEIIMCKLLVGTDGKEKMSKSLDNYISIVDTPIDMYGKTMSISDEQIINYFTLCTDIDPDKIADYQKRMEEGYNPRDIKSKLALEITRMYHGSDEAEKAAEYFEQVHQKKEIPDEIDEVELNGEFTIVGLLGELKMIESNSEGRRLVEQGGVKIDGVVITDVTEQIGTHPGMVVQVGKRRFVKIK
jgi:tyrosyl-tRNA synthetase